jgi:predicted kinase
MKLYIIRGLPGSGKSTMAKEIIAKHPNTKHFEADMYFYNAHGEYKFEPSLLREAHKWCLLKTEDALRNGYDCIVSNTFTQKWEMKAYLDLAKQYNAELEVITAKGNYQNIHGVPEETIEKMRKRWEDYQDL